MKKKKNSYIKHLTATVLSLYFGRLNTLHNKKATEFIITSKNRLEKERKNGSLMRFIFAYAVFSDIFI